MLYEKPLLQTVILLLVLILSTQIVKFFVRKFSVLRKLDVNRKKIILNFSYMGLYLITILVSAIIWGVDLRQFTVFISSVLAVLGVGFFAQWSILSNLTASVILFFNHPLRIGDRIRILDKDFDWSGQIIDITGFYLFMKTDKGETITIPNSIVMQKGIEILDKELIEEIDETFE